MSTTPDQPETHGGVAATAAAPHTLSRETHRGDA